MVVPTSEPQRPQEPLWLSLRFPQLPLDILGRSDQPLILTHAAKVYMACHKAQSLGITRGTSVSTALLLCQPAETNHNSSAEAVIRPYNPEQEERSLQQLAHWAYQFTPYVSLWAEQKSLLLELSGCLKLFGGLKPLLRRIQQPLQARQLNCVASLAHTPKAAWLLGWQNSCNSLTDHWQLKGAQANTPVIEEFFLCHLNNLLLSQLPLFPPFSEKLLQRLQNVGLKTLGELLRLPRESIAKRYGKECLQQLDQITGLAQDLQPYITPSTAFFSERHFLYGLENVATLERPAKDLLQEFREFLQSHQLQAESFTWRFFHFDKTHSEILIELTEAHAQADVFFQLTQLQLAKHQIQSPIETVSLRSDHLRQGIMQSRTLFRELGISSEEQSQANTLLDALGSRIGKDSIYQLHTIDEHLPESRQGFLQPLKLEAHPKPGKHNQQDTQNCQPPLPLWLLPSPQPLHQRQRKAMTLVSSGYRIDSHWWHKRQQRDYFIAQDALGFHWIYFDQISKHWFIHGHYG